MMITKNDVIIWFKALESYKRIDTMCTLLNMCLPFELRFLGTCLEELGRRDSQELRGMELRANNPQDLATDMIACQKGEPTDMKVRRKMALYLALIRACNRTNVTEIFRTLESWGELDFSTMTDIDTLKELLLVYTMAANHPVFEFDQHLKFMGIFEKIKENKLVADPPPSQTPPPAQTLHTQTSHQSTIENQALPMTPQHQQMHQHSTPPQQEIMQQHALQAALHAIHGQHHQLLAQTPMQMLPQGLPMSYTQMAKLIPSADGTSLQHQITTVEGIPHMISPNIIPDTSNTAAAIFTHPNAASWAMRQYHQQPPQTTGTQNLVDHPPQASSPMLSQQSSPSSSRATSPNRTSSCDSVGIMQNQHQPSQNPSQARNISQRLGGTSLKNIRRPSSETTPPPQMTQMGSEMIMPSNMKQEGVISKEGTVNHLQTLIRNGFPRDRLSGNHQRVKANTYIPPHQQQQQSPVNQHYQGNFGVNPGLTYAMQNMAMSDMSSSGHHSMDGNIMSMNSNKSTGSDSGSSMGSSGEISPPETPTSMMNNATTNTVMRVSGESQQTQQQQPTQKHHQPSQLSYNKQLSLQRLNGRSEKMSSSGGGGGGGSGNNVMNASAILYAQSQQQQQTQQSVANQQAIYAEMLPGQGASNAVTSNVLQTALTNNNPGGNPASNVVSSNNNMVGNNTVLISSPSAGAGTPTLGNVLSSNSVILSSHQQQYNATFPYHAHLASRPPIMTHSPGMPPPPHSTFRVPNFQLPPNGGELMYQPYHPNISIFSGAAHPLRTTNSAAAVVNNQSVTQQPPTPQQVAPPPQQQAQQPPQLQQLQQPPPPQASVLPSPYSSLNVSLSTKPLSCYNCGSQTHIGRECQEASMDDVTRNAIYKLDYSQAATGAGAGTPSAAAASTPPAQSQQSQQQQQSVSNSASESSISSATQHKSHDSSSSNVNVNSLSSSVASSASVSSATLAAATATAGAK
ncbi:nuclear receptor coactivator 6 [Stomoxys calcitrans]|uniref:nuclear receptor coactivator 6 n=1 Tax=Stomoxys calcitrans TaxID=35570 RepID=UPI0027E231E3|nr:nuclear receptor coactivator 6 [Stomoxys calcitrans]XP_013104084.2 nuclear receptor coactivator 6 [Stomoxys calcitrans]